MVRAFSMALAMGAGMGSVVSPMPREMMRTPGFFSWCARRRLAIWTHRRVQQPPRVSALDGTPHRHTLDRGTAAGEVDGRASGKR